MEHVAQGMRKCVKEGSFGGISLMCFRGVPKEKWVFSDEQLVQAFLALNEESKEIYALSTYSVVPGSTLETICFYWNLDRHFEGQYMRDYEHINNSLLDNKQTCWRDKYTTSVYSIDDTECQQYYELQPIPDFLRCTRQENYTTFHWKRELILKDAGTIFLELTYHQWCLICACHSF